MIRLVPGSEDGSRPDVWPPGAVATVSNATDHGATACSTRVGGRVPFGLRCRGGSGSRGARQVDVRFRQRTQPYKSVLHINRQSLADLLGPQLTPA